MAKPTVLGFFFLQMLFFLILTQHYCFRVLFSDFVSILDVQRQSCRQLSWVRKGTTQTQYYPELRGSASTRRSSQEMAHTYVACLMKIEALSKDQSNSIQCNSRKSDQIQMCFHTPEPLQ